MTWTRSLTLTEDAVAALDATDTDQQAADRLGCSVATLCSIASWRPEVRQARRRQSERRCERETSELVAALDATETLSDAARAFGISTYRLSGLIYTRQPLREARARQQERGPERVKIARVGLRARRQRELEGTGQQVLFDREDEREN